MRIEEKSPKVGYNFRGAVHYSGIFYGSEIRQLSVNNYFSVWIS